MPLMGLLHNDAPGVDVEYPTHGEHDETTPGIGEYLPAGHSTHDAVDVLKYEPAAQGANAVITTSPLPPLPELFERPGKPPTPTPET